MPFKLLVLAAAAAALAACDGPAETRASREVPQAPASSTAGGSQTPTTPANLPRPQTMEEKREGANPLQGQVDPKERAQHRDFQHEGDAAGPASPETAPRK